MEPGIDCLTCHTTSGSAPTHPFVVAGTIYGVTDQPDNCGGIAGVTVTVTDAGGNKYPLVTSLDGNFYLDSLLALNFAMPYTVTLSSGSQSVPMTSSASAGGCNSCHTQAGASGAAGRIVP
jgi:hypothetical protein